MKCGQEIPVSGEHTQKRTLQCSMIQRSVPQRNQSTTAMYHRATICMLISILCPVFSWSFVFRACFAGKRPSHKTIRICSGDYVAKLPSRYIHQKFVGIATFLQGEPLLSQNQTDCLRSNEILSPNHEK